MVLAGKRATEEGDFMSQFLVNFRDAEVVRQPLFQMTANSGFVIAPYRLQNH